MLASKITKAAEHASQSFFESVTQTVIEKMGWEKTETNEQISHQLSIRAHKTKVALERHMEERIEWCSKIFHPSMRDSADTQVVFTPIEFNLDPRHERLGVSQETVDLAEVLSAKKSILILGDIGSGKTTTLKKFAIDHHKSSGGFIFLRFRDFGEDLTIFGEICRIMQINVENQRPKKTETEDTITSFVFATPDIIEIANHAISRFLSKLDVKIFLDGFDELPLSRRTLILKEIEILSGHLSDQHLFLTSRPTEIRKAMPNFSIFEIEPLSEVLVHDFVGRWFSGVAERKRTFLKALEKTPYADVVDRPLMLTNLLIVFQKYHRLPDQPVSIYEKIINLCLEEWDASNETIRPTRYAQLEDRRKRDFLAGFAFSLLKANGGRISFNIRMLERIYVKNHAKFGLPEGEFKQVAQDIQSTTGIFVQAGYDLFEFSHKSLYEFLIAEYIVRSGFDSKVYDALADCPNEAAIAVALSTDPNQFLHRVLVKYGVPIRRDAEWVEVFIKRLLLEKPLLYPSDQLGTLVIWLQYLLCRQPSKFRGRQFFSKSAIKQSVAQALSDCDFSSLNSSIQIPLYFDDSGEVVLAGFSREDFQTVFGSHL